MKQNDALIYNKLHYEGKDNGYYEFKSASTPTTYGFCWNNEMARFTPKVVHFELGFQTDADRAAANLKQSLFYLARKYLRIR